MTWWQWTLLIIGSLAALPFVLIFVVAPLIAWRLTRVPAKPTFRSVGDHDGPADTAVQTYVDDVWASLQAGGFERAGQFVQTNAQPKTKTRFWAFCDSDRHTIAIVWAISSKVLRQRVHQHQLDIVTSLAGDRTLTTTNADLPPCLPRRTEALLTKLTTVRDPGQLVAIHWGLLARDHASEIAPFEDPDPICNLTQAVSRDLAFGVAQGYFVRRGDACGLSLRGAFRGTLDMVWPRRQRHLQADEELAAKLKKDFAAPERRPTPPRQNGVTVFGLEEPGAQPRFVAAKTLGVSRHLLIVRGSQILASPAPERREILLTDTQLQAPGGVKIDYGSLIEISHLKTGAERTVVVRGRDQNGRHVRADLPDRLFVDPEHSAAKLVSMLHSAVVKAGGSGRAKELARMQRWRARTMHRRAWVTCVLVVSMILGFMAQQGVLAAPSTLAAFVGGAFVPDLVMAGEVHRLLIANAYSHGWLHFSLVALVVWPVGAIAEKLLGSRPFAVVALLGGATGYASLLIHAGGWEAVGGSSVAAALAGAMGTLHFRLPENLGIGAGKGGRWGVAIVCFLLAVIAALEWFAFQSALHVVAFAAGAILTFFVLCCRNFDDKAGPVVETIGSAVMVSATVAVIVAAIGLTRPIAQFTHSITQLSAVRAPDCWSLSDLGYRASTIDSFRERTTDVVLSAMTRCAGLPDYDEPHFLQSMAATMTNLGRQDDARRALYRALSMFESHDDPTENAAIAADLVAAFADARHLVLGAVGYSIRHQGDGNRYLQIESATPMTLVATVRSTSTPAGTSEPHAVVRLEIKSGAQAFDFAGLTPLRFLIADARQGRIVSSQPMHVFELPGADEPQREASP